jgi:hypothetical protein
MWCPLPLPRSGPVGPQWAVPGIHSPETKISVHPWWKIQAGHCIYFGRTTVYMVQLVKEATGICLHHKNVNIDMGFNLNLSWYPATSKFQHSRKARWLSTEETRSLGNGKELIKVYPLCGEHWLQCKARECMTSHTRLLLVCFEARTLGPRKQQYLWIQAIVTLSTTSVPDDGECNSFWKGIPFHLDMVNCSWRHHCRTYSFDFSFICDEVHRN